MDVITICDQTCRLCLVKDADVVEIDNIERMGEKIHMFLHVEVTMDDDQWPLVICPGCISKINDWETYYDQVRSNEQRLQSLSVKEEQTDLFYEIRVQEDDEEEEEEAVENDGPLVMCIEKENLEIVGDGIKEFIDEVDTEEVVDVNDDGPADAETEDIGLEMSVYDVSEPEPPKEKVKSSPRGRRKKNASPQEEEESEEETEFEKQFPTKRKVTDDLIREYACLDCDSCNKRCKTFEQLLLHYRTEHDNTNGYAKCCNKTFKRRYVLVDHVRLHLNPNQYACEICSKKFTTKRHLIDHQVLHIPENEREYQCDQCPKRYATQGRLKLHIKSHNAECSFQCPQCDKAYRLESVLKNHIKTAHENRVFICDKCAKVFKTKDGFKAHQAEHLEPQPERIKCEVCGGKFKNKDSLKYHMLRHKREHERYYCDICHREFNCKKRMRAHRKYVHASESDLHQCTICYKAFKRPIVLKEHMASHTGQLLYTCAYCPRQFNSNANKYSHQKAQHPLEWEKARQLKKETG